VMIAPPHPQLWKGVRDLATENGSAAFADKNYTVRGHG